MTQSVDDKELLTSKNLADALGRKVRFVYDMRRGGFPMPAGYATLEQAREWLIKNPSPSRYRHRRKSHRG